MNCLCANSYHYTTTFLFLFLFFFFSFVFLPGCQMDLDFSNNAAPLHQPSSGSRNRRNRGVGHPPGGASGSEGVLSPVLSLGSATP